MVVGSRRRPPGGSSLAARPWRRSSFLTFHHPPNKVPPPRHKPHRSLMLRLRSGLATHGIGRSLLIGLVRATFFATLETRLKLVSRLGSAQTYSKLTTTCPAK